MNNTSNISHFLLIDDSFPEVVQFKLIGAAFVSENVDWVSSFYLWNLNLVKVIEVHLVTPKSPSKKQ